MGLYDPRRKRRTVVVRVAGEVTLLLGPEANMSLREGTRRLALLFGVVGAILGGFASYMELQSVMREKADHQRFEQLANSQIVQQERKAIYIPGFGPPEDSTSALEPVPDGPVTVQGPDGKIYQFPEGTDKAAAIRYFKRRSIGIEAIHWTENYGIASIETRDGQTLYPTPAPSAWLYVWVALFPIIGFFIPWGAIRAIGWVGSGFAQSVQ